jgi:2-oxoacid:acceptor oxidoreductase gamma subunit (pyruvate/2-ketoisovalerate family)
MLYPDHVVVMESNLFEEVNVTEGLKEGGHLIINSPLPADSFKDLDEYRVSTFDCSRVATACGLGNPPTPIINTVMLGALAKLTGMVRLESAIQGIKRWIAVKPDLNIEAAKRAFEQAVSPSRG